MTDKIIYNEQSVYYHWFRTRYDLFTLLISLQLWHHESIFTKKKGKKTVKQGIFVLCLQTGVNNKGMLGCALYINMSDFTYLRHCSDLKKQKTCTEAAVQQVKAQSDEYRLW